MAMTKLNDKSMNKVVGDEMSNEAWRMTDTINSTFLDSINNDNDNDNDDV